MAPLDASRPTPRRAGTWLAATTSAVLAVLALGACSPGPDGAAFPTREDLARAQAAWTDPWLALDEDTAPPAPGPVVDVIRPEVGSRTWEIDATLDATALEESAARSAGWVEVELCDSPNWPSRMWRKGTGDDALLAELEVIPGDPTHATSVTVTAYAHHHLSSVWPGEADPQGCLPPPVTQLDEETTVAHDRVPVPELDEASSPSTLDAPASVLDGDPTLERLGLVFSRSTTPRQSYLAVPVATVDVAGSDLRQAVQDATDDGWALTFTVCRPEATRLAELRRDVGDGAVAALRLTTAADGGSSPGTLRARALVTRAAYGGPPTAVPEEAVDPCWASGSDEASTTGTPWFGPELAVPIQE